MLQSYKLSALAKLENCSRDTIKKRPDKYLAIRVDSYESKRSVRGYSIRYVRVSDIKARLNA